MKKLVAVEGGDLRLNITGSASTERPLYIGTLDWDSVELARRRDVPIPANVSAKFSLSPDGFTLEQAVVDLGRSHFDLQAQTKNLESPDWTYQLSRHGWTCWISAKLSARRKFPWAELICAVRGR